MNPTDSALLALFTFLLGLLVGHRLSLFRDRRKERNEVALRLKVAFERALEHGSIKHERADWLLYLHLTGRLNRIACERAMAEHQAASRDTEDNPLGEPSYRNPDRVKAATATLHRLIKLS